MISTVDQYLAYIEENYSDRIAFQYYHEEQRQVQARTYAQYVQDIRRYAAYLKANVPDVEGKHVGILARNSYHYLVCMMGTMLAGAVVVPLNYEESWDNIQYQIRFAEIICLFHDDGYLEREPGLGEQYASILDRIDAYTNMKQTFMPVGTGSTMEEEKLVMILFTSGTTGRSKGVMLSNRNFYAPLKYFMNAGTNILSMGAKKYMLFMPMYHVSGITIVQTWNSLGVPVNICQDIKYLYRDLKLMNSDITSVVPVILQSFYKDIQRGKAERLGGLKSIFCGAAPMDSDMIQTFRDHGIAISKGYGMTEIFGAGTNCVCENPEKYASVGQAGAGCQIRIDQGEICLKSEAVMLGYYKNPEATKEMIRDGWLHTGDLGYLDEDGYLYVTGRKKNLIILSSGENVSPEELENLLLENPEITEVLVKEKGDKICAEIFCSESHQDSVKKYVSCLNRSLAFYKRITVVEFRKEPFTKTASGKIRRG